METSRYGNFKELYPSQGGVCSERSEALASGTKFKECQNTQITNILILSNFDLWAVGACFYK